MIEDTDDVASGFVWIAMGVELGLDVRAFGPFPKESFLFGFGVGLFESQALLFDGQAAGDEIAATQSDDVAEVVAHFAQIVFGGLGEWSSLGCGREASGDPMDEVVDEGCRNKLVGLGVLSCFFGDKFDGGLPHLPTAERGAPVIGEVLLGDGLAFEMVGDDGASFWQGIQPREQRVAGLSVGEATVELVSDCRGEARDFAEHKEKG